MSEHSQSQNEARAAYLGISIGVGRCVLRGHDDHEAVATVGEHGFLSYTCERVAEPLTVAEVFATTRHAFVEDIAPERVERLSRVLASRWQERLDYEAGLRKPRPLPLTPPSRGLGRAASVVLEHMQLFLGLRDCERWLDDTFTWARRFSMAYCRVGNGAARHGIAELRKLGVIEVVREQRHGYDAIVYRLAAAVLASRAAEQAG